ncbi:MAG: hypothetical protein GW939_00240 [Candidatus Magasanikbacteria bacterium]|nr:hypothetical protein [Candidatus Magasanikbacteria bacterium]NCS72245.1 hypothetical protein [Candidatus Magasanikbacteria bacterium]
MQDIQSVFVRIEENKKKLKDLKDTYNDALSTSQSFQEVQESLKSLKEKKKQIEQTIKDGFSSELIQMDDLKIDIASDKELLSDIALTQVMKGETVAVTDQYENEYEPTFSVKFKKIT